MRACPFAKRMPRTDFVGDLSKLCNEEQMDRAFQAVDLQGIPISRDIVYCLLQGCAKKRDLSAVRRVHSLMISSRLDSIAVLGDHLIRLFASCGSLSEAYQVFCKILKPSVYTWNAIISAHVKLGEGYGALDLYHKMHVEGIEPDKVTFSCILKACTNEEAIDQGRLFHSQIIRSGFEIDVVVGSTLVDMYAKCGSLEEARRVFNKLPNQNVVTWGAMIAAYATQGHGLSALELFEKMQQEGIKPDKVLGSSILKACSSIGAIDQGRLIRDKVIRSGFKPDLVFQNTVIDMFAKCGKLQEARKTFDELPDRDVVSWGAMIAGYAQNGCGLSALNFFEEMQEKGIKPDKVIFLSGLKACANIGGLGQGRWIHSQFMRSGFTVDVVIGSTLVDMYAKCGSLEEAHKVFDDMPSHNVVAWSAMIAACAEHGQGLLALELFEKVRHEDIKPDRVIFLCILRVCGSLGALSQSRLIHDEIIRNELDSDVVVGSTLIDVYAKCSSLEEAHKVFDKLLNRDLVSWCAIIAGYGRYGNYRLAEQCLVDMQCHGMKPNDVVFSSILAACRHAGLLEEGCWYFRSMREDHGIAPNLEHYSCMVDLLGREGHFDEAEDMLQTMPISPDNVVWMSLLTSCRIYGNMELGKHCFKQIVQLEPLDASGYVLMSDIYSDSDMEGDVDRLHELRKCAGAEKMPGLAWVEVNKKVHEFVVDSNLHPRGDEIHSKLKRIKRCMEGKGYLPKLDLVLDVMSFEGKEDILCGHSE